MLTDVKNVLFDVLSVSPSSEQLRGVFSRVSDKLSLHSKVWADMKFLSGVTDI